MRKKKKRIKEQGSGRQKMAIDVEFKFLKIVAILETSKRMGVPQAGREKKLLE